MRYHEPNTEGYWGNGTATLDWCERNFEICNYIAEFWNTLSNLLMVVLALFGLYTVHKYKFETRFSICYLGLMVVGIGSWCFHATLLYSMQLLDELPMIYGTCVFVYCVLEDKRKPRFGLPLIIGLALYAIIVTGVYLKIETAEFHQTAYGILVSIVIFKCAYHNINGDIKDPQVTRLFKLGLVSYLGGFALWNIDNFFCEYLRAARESLPFPFTGLLELHAWWHIGTGYGTYLYIVFNQYLRSALLYKENPNVSIDTIGSGSEYLTYAFGFLPYLAKGKDLKKGFAKYHKSS